MQRDRVYAYLWKAVRLLFACVLLALVSGVVGELLEDRVHSAITRQSRHSQNPEIDKLFKLPGLSPVPGRNDAALANIYLWVDAKRLTGSYVLYLPKEVWAQLQHVDRINVVGWYGATIAINNGSTITFNRPAFRAQNGSYFVEGELEPFEWSRLGANVQQVTVSIGGPPARFATHTFHISVKGERNVALLVLSGAPMEQERGRIEFVDVPRSALPVRVGVITPALLPGNRTAVEQQRVSELVSGYAHSYHAFIEPLLRGLTYTLPFMLFLIYCGREERWQKAREFAAAMIVLFAGLGVARAILDLLQDSVPWLEAKLHFDYLGNAISGSGALIVLFVTVFWPRWKGNVTFVPRLTWGNAVACTLALGSIAGLAYYAWYIGDPLLGSTWGTAAASTLSAAIVAFWIAYELGRRWLGVVDAFLFLLVLALYIAIMTGAYVYYGRPVVAALLLYPFVTVVIRMVFDALRDAVHGAEADTRSSRMPWYDDDSTPRPRRRWPDFSLGLIDAMVIITLVYWLVRLANGDDTTSIFWIVGDFAWTLAQPATLFLAIIVLLELRERSRTGHWAILEDGERNAGMVLALSTFFLPARHWLYIPIVFAGGFFVLRKWIFVNRQLTAATAPNVSYSVRRIIEANEAERTLKLRRKELAEQAAKGTIDLDRYIADLAHSADYTDSIRRQSDTNVLALGAQVEPWERGVSGAKYGAIFALLWIVVYLRQFHYAWIPDRGYSWLPLFADVIKDIGQWPLYGFFFGYFYPHLRGDSGWTKGIYYFLIVATPSFAGTALAMASDTRAWQALMFWSLQLFVQSTMLGLVIGDYETLRRAGLRWRHLMDVHNLGSVVTWVLTLVASIGSALIAVMTERAMAFLK